MKVLIQIFQSESFDKWKAAFDGNQEWRTKMTFHNPRVFRGSDNPDQIMLIAQVDDPQPYFDFMKSDLWAKRTAKSGHISEGSQVLVMDEVPLYL